MFSSVRWRITLWTLSVVAFVLVTFSAAVYLMLSRALYERVDNSVEQAIEVAAASLAHEIDEHHGKQQGEESFRTVLESMPRDTFPLHGIAVYEGDRSIAEKPGPGGKVPPRPTPGTPRYATAAGHRIGWGVFEVAAVRARYVVVASQSLDHTTAELRTLRRVIVIAIPVALLLAALGGYLLARRSLAPVVVMSETAQRIGSQSLEQRIPVVNAGDELGKLAITFNGLLERLHAAFARQRQFMADASHELRTPVSISLTATQVTLESKSSSEADYRDALTVVEQQMQRLTHVVRDMMTLALADAGVYTPKCATFYADELLAEVVRAAGVLAGRKAIELRSEADTDVLLQADEGLVRQLLMILLDNAIKYTPDGGEVSVRLHERELRAVFEVADSGPGIPEDAQPHIFERFYRVDKARARSMAAHTGGGSGLGLAIGRWIAEAHGGSLELTRSDVSGSVFTAVLPGARRAPATSIPAEIMKVIP